MIDPIRSRIFFLRMCLALASSLTAVSAGRGEDGASGITRPQVLEPLTTRCAGLPPERKGKQSPGALLRTINSQFMEGVSYGLSMAAKDRDLNYQVSLANSG